MSYDVKLIDIINLIVAGVSLGVAVVALKISDRVAKMSISRPFVIEKLYDLFEYRKTRQLSDDPVKDVDRLIDEVQRVRRMTLVLEQAGFGQRVKELEAAQSVFSTTRQELARVVASGHKLTADQSDQMTGAAVAMDKALQRLLSEIEPKLRQVMKDPLKDWA